MKTVELALKAGRLRQSPVTSFVHHWAENPDHAREAIPIYENFCFALALFRTRAAENVLEGKALLEKLFAFQQDGGFPVYLHEYPLCRSHRLVQKLAPVAHFLLRDFAPVLGEALRNRLQNLSSCMTAKANPQTAEEWAEALIHSQTTDAFHLWDPKALCFTADQKQERGEPEVTLLDLILGEWTGRYSHRALQDHPIHLQASLIYPGSLSCPSPAQKWSRRFWGDGSPTHSALLYTRGTLMEENNFILIDLPEKEVLDEVEISYYLNKHPGTFLTVAGMKATTFQLGEPVRVESGGEAFEIRVSLQEGNGRFWGHIYFGNRPGQLGGRGALKYEAFDWQIALRTIERKDKCVVKIEFQKC